MGHRRSLVRQGTEKLLKMAAYGDSKYEDKKSNRGLPAREKIYSSKTMDNYIDYCARFLHWVQKTHGCRYLEEALPHVNEYLEQRIETHSAWTVRAEAAGIAKLFQCSMNDFGVTLPKRSRDNITQHREQKWIGLFSPEKHRDLVEFCLSTGLRRRECKAAAPDDIWEEDGQVYIKTVGKGGRHRIVTCLNDAPLKIAQAAAERGQSLIFEEGICKYCPAHEYRAQFSAALYTRLARPLDEIPLDEQYICRGSKKGVVYDKKALSVVAVQLGHGAQRLSLVANNYLYGLDQQ
jgi:hypothetical protein